MSEHNHEHHISTAGQLWAVGIALLFLTVITVVFGKFVPIPSPFDIVFALSIALIKAFLVAAFFMNLYWDVKFNTMLLIGAATFFILMFSVTLLDTMFRVDVVPGF
ncbi:cytochrome C oxidase subunit IV family protein [Balneola sp. MJW-20]|uniref:cytochrome C oxidase subunit IV family protein n=1 Tax=Gracilimonas aurantiaca TaxID=3234185 RepID=UPI003466DC3C